MLSDDLLPAALCQLIYDKPAYFDKIIDNGSVYLGIKVIGDDRIVVTCRGSITKVDWIHDLESLIFTRHNVLGIVGQGFIQGVDDAFTQLCASLPALHPGGFYPLKMEFYGHSLGGAHAAYLAGLFRNAGYKVKLVMFEAPRTCGQVMMDFLKDCDVTCYCNGDDLVPELPLGLVHPRELIKLDCPPVTGDITPFKYHHMALAVCGAVLRQVTLP